MVLQNQDRRSFVALSNLFIKEHCINDTVAV